MKRKMLTTLIAVVVLISGLILPVYAGELLELNTNEIKIYAINSQLEDILSIPVEFLSSMQIQVKNIQPGETVKYTANTTNINVSTDGTITAAPTYWTKLGGGMSSGSQIKPEHYDYIDYSYGTFSVTVTAGTKSAEVIVHVVNYLDEYIESELNLMAKQIMAENETELGRLDAICKWVASFEYDYRYQGPAGFIIYGGGDCWASTNSIIFLADLCGMRARSRDATRDIGAGSGHMNAVVEVDGVPYIAEAGYADSAPRSYNFEGYPSGYILAYPFGSSTANIREYIGFDTDIVVPAIIDDKTIISIKEMAFRRNGIEKVTLSEGITAIETNAFYLSGVTELHLPSTISSIEERPFVGAERLEVITISEDNPYYEIQDGMIHSKGGEILIACPNSKKGEVIIPDSVVEIGTGAFFWCINITKITTGENLRKIGFGAFYNSGIKNIIINQGTETIEEMAFAHLNPVNVHIPASVTSIHDDAFIGANATIYGEPGSYAETFANEKDIKFIDIITLQFQKGDVNDDGEITIKDAIEIFRFLAGKTEFSDNKLLSADIDGDGEVTIKDAIQIFRYLADKITI